MPARWSAVGGPQRGRGTRGAGMCLILLALEARSDLPLVIAANRDEFYARPTALAAPWPDAPQVIAGRDLRQGGTWLGITTAGRWAAVTNFREPENRRTKAPSRGRLVADYLLGDLSPAVYLDSIASEAHLFHGFNLLVGSRSSVRWFSNRAGDHPLQGRELTAGVYGLSNDLLDTPWPKVVEGKREMREGLEAGADPDTLMQGLLDRTLAAEADLPETGVPREVEHALSARFIAGIEYGTRSSTVIRVEKSGRALLLERSFRPPATIELSRHEFEISS